MTVILPSHNLAYIPVPKVACTSIKQAFFRTENGTDFTGLRANERDWSIHDIYPAVLFDDLPHAQLTGLRRVAIVRDPVDRFLSSYTNRVLKHGALSWWRMSDGLTREKLAPDPDFGGFLWGIDAYRRISTDIYHHTLPLTAFLGTDPAYFDRIYRWSELDAFAADMAAQTGKPFTLGHLQTSDRKLKAADIDSTQVAEIRDRYADDYAAFSEWLT